MAATSIFLSYPSSSSAIFTLSPRVHYSSWYHSSCRTRARLYARRWVDNLHVSTNRLNSFYSSCSITNTDVCSSIATEDDVHEELSADAPNRSIPIVHLNSNALETEPLNLLAEGTYVDTLLTTLPVLTEEEQNIIAATPAHPAGLYGPELWVR